MDHGISDFDARWKAISEDATGLAFEDRQSLCASAVSVSSRWSVQVS
jgi:hypothetical protein